MRSQWLGIPAKDHGQNQHDETAFDAMHEHAHPQAAVAPGGPAVAEGAGDHAGQQHPLAERLDAASLQNGEAPRPSLLGRPSQRQGSATEQCKVCSSLISDPAKMTGWSGEPHRNQAVELVASK